MQMALETRFTQLNAATKLELWQEAFRSVEDLHGLMMMSKKAPKLSMLVNFYDKISCIFLMSDDFLFHASANLKYFNVAAQSGSMTADELNKYVCSDEVVVTL
jgi:translation initiation factor 3 subunit A